MLSKVIAIQGEVGALAEPVGLAWFGCYFEVLISKGQRIRCNATALHLTTTYQKGT